MSRHGAEIFRLFYQLSIELTVTFFDRLRSLFKLLMSYSKINWNSCC